MKEYKEEDFLMLSGIQHYAFCKRQWALIHIEEIWQDNYHTVIGNILHEKVHDPYFTEKRGDIIISRAMPIRSFQFGLSGECDCVEFHKDKSGVAINGRQGTYVPYPVEYKKGAPKKSDIDIMQLTAQIMCLEEMFCCCINYGYLYYGKTKRREKVEITSELKNRAKLLLEEMHALYKRGHTPKVKPTKACKSCSLQDVCLPVLCKNKSARFYIEKILSEE